jgi:hypothetical protein
MIFVTPAFNAVTRPEAGFTVATDGSERTMFHLCYRCCCVAVAPIHADWRHLIVPANTSGLTVIVKVLSEPVQVTEALVKAGVTVIVAVTGTKPVLIAVNAAIFPVPPAASPIVLLFVQLYTVPGTLPVKLTAAVNELLQTVWLEMVFTVGEGFTVMVYMF